MTEHNAANNRIADEDALLGFAKFWPEALKRANEIGLTRSGFDLRVATELARNVYIAAFYDGAVYGGSRLKDALLATKNEHNEVSK